MAFKTTSIRKLVKCRLSAPAFQLSSTSIPRDTEIASFQPVEASSRRDFSMRGKWNPDRQSQEPGSVFQLHVVLNSWNIHNGRFTNQGPIVSKISQIRQCKTSFERVTTRSSSPRRRHIVCSISNFWSGDFDKAYPSQPVNVLLNALYWQILNISNQLAETLSLGIVGSGSLEIYNHPQVPFSFNWQTRSTSNHLAKIWMETFWSTVSKVHPFVPINFWLTLMVYLLNVFLVVKFGVDTGKTHILLEAVEMGG